LKELLRPNVGITCIIKNVFNMFNPRKIQIFINKKVYTFNKAIKKQAEKATKAMFEVLKRGRRHNLSIECQLELFNGS
jgi:hypothetical protein